MLFSPLFSVMTPYIGATNSRNLSPRLWKRMLNGNATPDGGRGGFFAGDDFGLFGQSVAVASNVGCYVSQAGQYKSYEGTGTSISQLATEQGGVIRLSTAATDNIDVSLCQGGAGTSAATSVLGAINRDTNPRLTIFETRFRLSSITDDVAAIFLGLMEENGAVVSAKVNDTGATIDNDYIGFETVHTNGGTTGANAALRAVYKTDGQTAKTVITPIQTMVASTWYKVGFVYDPAADASKRITFYVDNTEQSTYVTDTMMNVSGTTAAFPDGEELGFTAIMKAGSAAAANFDIDWWAFYQENS